MSYLYLRVELDDEKDIDVVRRKIENITGVLEVFPCVQADDDCPAPLHTFTDGSRACTCEKYGKEVEQ